VAELAIRRAEGAPLIDVREDDEFAEAHVPGAHLIPLGEVVERIDEVPDGQTVYVICARGARSAKAVAHYRGQGIDAVNVAGGTLAWIDAGQPTDALGRGAEGA
jgi:rhodanese-related sulfurtransferase